MTGDTMQERPILFSDKMVRAISGNGKTQTRRVVNPQPPEGFVKWYGCTDGYQFWTDNPGQGEKGHTFQVRNPYPSGGCLWVRETWALRRWWEDDAGVDYRDWSGALPDSLPGGWTINYRADWDEDASEYVWRSPIHMPRWASRITLEIVNVCVERLQDISEEDARAEGMIPNWCGPDLAGWNPDEHGFLPIDYESRYLPDDIVYCTAKEAFALSWDVINSKRGYTWASNPWVWVVEFSLKQ